MLRDRRQALSHFPFAITAAVLGERFREDRLGLTAGSLTFTTTIALVPFFTVALAVFTVFPMFDQLQAQLQRWLIASLIPENISRQVLGYLTQFASKASGLGALGLVVLLVTAVSLILTIDKALNAIWRVRRPRPLAQRVLIYWAVITLGPLVLALSLSTTAYVVSVSRSLVGGGMVKAAFSLFELLLLAAGAAALYRFVPNTRVEWRHAFAGGAFAAVAIELAKRVLSFYLGHVPTYSMLYGAFATVPIFLIWIYVAWVIVLLGAVIAAYLPSLLRGVWRRGGGAGWNMQLAIEVLQGLDLARAEPARGLGLHLLAERLRVDPLQLEPVVEALMAIDWIGVLDEDDSRSEARYVLLADPARTPIAPLLTAFLMPRAPSLEKLWSRGPLEALRLSDALPYR